MGALSIWHPYRIRATKRAQRALELRLKGWTYQEIADEMSTDPDLGRMTKTGIVRAVQRQLEREHGRVEEMTVQLRRQDCARLEMMYKSLEVKIEAGDERAILTAERLLARRAKLMGLDIPIAVKNGDGGDAAELLGMAMIELEQEAQAEQLQTAKASVVKSIPMNANGNGKKRPKKKAPKRRPGRNGKNGKA